MKKIGTTGKTRKELHKELWLWCSENPKKGKKDWPGWIDYDIFKNDIVSYKNKCFCCGHIGFIKYNGTPHIYCPECPINWSGGDGDNVKCESLGTIYTDWLHETNLDKRSIMAKVIAFAWK